MFCVVASLARKTYSLRLNPDVYEEWKQGIYGKRGKFYGVLSEEMEYVLLASMGKSDCTHAQKNGDSKTYKSWQAVKVYLKNISGEPTLPRGAPILKKELEMAIGETHGWDARTFNKYVRAFTNFKWLQREDETHFWVLDDSDGEIKDWQRWIGAQ